MARQGKIARLSYEIREELNRRMRDGVSSPKLIAWLAEQGITGINAQNITNWRQGGYSQWLKNQAHLDQVRAKSETVRRELEAGGFSILDKAIYDFADRIAGEEIDPTRAASAVAVLRNAVTAAERARIYSRRADLSEKALHLEEAKYRRQTCELFIKWSADRDAARIASDPAIGHAAKIEQLGQKMFGDEW